MSHSKLFPLILTLMLITVAGRAEIQRPLFSLENAFPRWEQFETGITYTSVEGDDDSLQPDRQAVTPYLRYGLLENLAVRVDIPYVNVDPAFGGSENGFGDIEVELQLRTWEDIFRYPYFLPHVSFTLPTGDEDEGLGSEDSVIEVGMSYGDKLFDSVRWILDVSYRVNGDDGNQLLVGNSYIWDVSERFALLGEVYYEEEIEETADSLVIVSGGLSYDWTQDLQMGAHIGGALTGDTEIHSEVRFSYNF